jgi:hypothetical protein
MLKIEVAILDLLTTRPDELTMEIGMPRGRVILRKRFQPQLDQNEPALDIAYYMFLFATIGFAAFILFFSPLFFICCRASSRASAIPSTAA